MKFIALCNSAIGTQQIQIRLICLEDQGTQISMVFTRDEFELEFSGSSKPELGKFRAELSRAGHFNFRAKTELTNFRS